MQRANLTVFLVAASATSLAANWLWEMVQMPAYVEMAGKTWGETAIPCGIASLGDLVMTLMIFALVGLAAGTLRWAIEWRWNCFAAAAVLGALFAMGYEWRVLAFGRWSYSSAHAGRSLDRRGSLAALAVAATGPRVAGGWSAGGSLPPQIGRRSNLSAERPVVPSGRFQQKDAERRTEA